MYKILIIRKRFYCAAALVMCLWASCLLSAQISSGWLVDSLPVGKWHSPVLSPDGNLLFLVNEGNPRNMGAANAEDIWMLQRRENGVWSRALQLGPFINSRLADGVVAAGPAASWLLLFSPEKGEAPRIAVRAGRAWQLTDSIHIDEVKDWSQVKYCFLDANRAVFLFSVDWESGFGGQDIYRSVLTADGHWSKPENLGAGVNSPRDEVAPLLAADGQTLYFESEDAGGQILRLSRKNLRTNQWERASDVNISWPYPSTSGPHRAIFPDGKRVLMLETDSLGNTRPRWRLLPENAIARPMQVIMGKCHLPGPIEGNDVEVYTREPETNSVKQEYVDPFGNFCVLVPTTAVVSIEGRRPGYFSVPVLIGAEKEAADETINWRQLGSFSTSYYQTEDSISVKQKRLLEVGGQLSVLRERYEIRLHELAGRLRAVTAHEWGDSEREWCKGFYEEIKPQGISPDSFVRLVHLLKEDIVVGGLIDSFLKDLRRGRMQHSYGNLTEKDWDKITSMLFRDLMGRMAFSAAEIQKFSKDEQELISIAIKGLSIPLDLTSRQGYQNLIELIIEAVELHRHQTEREQLEKQLDNLAVNQAREDEKLADRAEREMGNDQFAIEEVDPIRPTAESRKVGLTFERLYDGARFVIDDLYFYEGGIELTDKGMMIVGYLKWVLDTHPDIRVLISCHTHGRMQHSRAIDQTNQRARSIKNKLVELGVDPGRVALKGFGKLLPIVADNGPASLLVNQRTEVWIMRETR